MCTMSMIMDDWNKRTPFPDLTQNVSRFEFDALKAEVEAMKALLKAAKIYDEETGQPNCETADKIAAFKKLAEFLEIDMKDIFE